MSRFERLREQDMRVASAAYRLSVAGQARCWTMSAPQPGFVLHSLAQYALRDRAEAASNYGSGQHIAVMTVVPRSPAERAGLMANDELISVNGIVLDGGGGSVPSRAPVERAEKIIAEEMRKGVVTLSVSGPGGEREVRLAADLGCPSRVELVPDSHVNAWADGERVVVTTGILDQCRTDDELALVIAHEMAHNILHHRRRPGAVANARGLLPILEVGSAEMREAEEEADRFAVGMTGAAGYDLRQAAPFLRRLL